MRGSSTILKPSSSAIRRSGESRSASATKTTSRPLPLSRTAFTSPRKLIRSRSTGPSSPGSKAVPPTVSLRCPTRRIRLSRLTISRAFSMAWGPWLANWAIVIARPLSTWPR